MREGRLSGKIVGRCSEMTKKTLKDELCTLTILLESRTSTNPWLLPLRCVNVHCQTFCKALDSLGSRGLGRHLQTHSWLQLFLMSISKWDRVTSN